MTMIACGECTREVSDKAVACPGCGAPVGPGDLSQGAKPARRKTTPAAWAGLVAIVAGLFWYSNSRDYKEQSLPPLPVEVKHRPALLGPGEVLQVRNKSGSSLMALVTLSNPTTKQTKSFRIDIAPEQFAEIGHKEGWVLASGDQIVIANDAFQSWKGSL
jgi:hypothetical protein